MSADTEMEWDESWGAPTREDRKEKETSNRDWEGITTQ